MNLNIEIIPLGSFGTINPLDQGAGVKVILPNGSGVSTAHGIMLEEIPGWLCQVSKIHGLGAYWPTSMKGLVEYFGGNGTFPGMEKADPQPTLILANEVEKTEAGWKIKERESVQEAWDYLEKKGLVLAKKS